MADLLTLIETVVRLRHVARTNGGEYAGPCPWCGGKDRFHVWPAEGDTGRFWCRGCEKKGDGIDFARQYYGDGFRAACERIGAYDRIPPDSTSFPASAGNRGKLAEPRRGTDTPRSAPIPPPAEPLSAPCETWQRRGRALCDEAAAVLWTVDGARALAWLRGRGLTDETIRTAGLGYNPADRHEERASWGFVDDGKRIWIPRGVVIPWYIAGEVWRVNVRRPVRGEDDGPKYIGPAGSSAGLYGADGFRPDVPAVLVEGELDALTITQDAGELVTAVATGSTGGARRPRWIARLAARPLVLVAFDSDEAGEAAARFWCETLPNARRWRPYVHDANDMHRGGMDVRAWIAAGLEYAGGTNTGTNTPHARGDDGEAVPLDEPGKLPPEAFGDGGNSNGNTFNARVVLPPAVAVDMPELSEGVAPLPEPHELPRATAARLELIPIEDAGEDDNEPHGACRVCGRKTYWPRARDGIWTCIQCGTPTNGEASTTDGRPKNGPQ